MKTQSLTQRLALVKPAVADEQRRFNEAIQRGVRVLLRTFCGEYLVTDVTADWWYHTANGPSWCGCNDGTWAELMKQAGLARHPLFAKFAA